jgi:Uma2 family endonuclease
MCRKHSDLAWRIRESSQIRTCHGRGWRLYCLRRAVYSQASILFDRQPDPSHDPYNPNPPDLAIEVLSPTDDPSKFRIKLSNYLAASIVVWVVDPERRMVEIHQSGQPVQIVDQDGTLDGGDILPGFTLAVSDIFPAEHD